MIPFLTEIYGFSYHYTANAPTLQEIFIIFLCRHAPFSAGKPARPERRAPGRPGKRPLPGAAGRESRRAGFAPRSRKRIPYGIQHPLSSKPFGRKIKKARDAGLPRCRKKERAVSSHTKPYPAIGAQALPAGRVQSPFQNRFGIVYIPVCVLFCAITRKICLISRFSDAHRNHRCA